jgi:hypothetical protein
VVPPTKLSGTRGWGCGPLPVLQTFRAKSRSPGVAGCEKERVIVPRPGVRTAFNSSTPYFSLLDISLDRAGGSTILVVSDGFDYGVVRFSERTIAEEGIANGDSEHEIGEPARKKRPVKISRATRMCKTKYSYRCFHVILPRLLSLDLGFARNTILQRTIKSRTFTTQNG